MIFSHSLIIDSSIIHYRTHQNTKQRQYRLLNKHARGLKKILDKLNENLSFDQ